MNKTNWRAMQAYGCKSQDFEKPFGIKPRAMAGGSFHASLMKGGAKHNATGGSPKPKKRITPKMHVLAHPDVRIDKKGYVIHDT